MLKSGCAILKLSWCTSAGVRPDLEFKMRSEEKSNGKLYSLDQNGRTDESE